MTDIRKVTLRPLFLLALCVATGACSFSHGTAPVDADSPIDSVDATPLMWAVDPTSMKAVPRSGPEWRDFIAAHQLTLSPPTSIWLMQELSSPSVLNDEVSAVQLAPDQSPEYHITVPGWSRYGVATIDGTYNAFYNRTAPALPDVMSQSMTILVMYATTSTPPTTRSILFGGSGTAPSFGEVDIDASNHFILTVAGSTATGSVDHGSGVIPLILKLDHTHQQQHLVTNKEIIAPTYSPLSTSHGVLIGGANNRAPAGIWVYMVAWYGATAEISDTDLQSLIAALGWT